MLRRNEKHRIIETKSQFRFKRFEEIRRRGVSLQDLLRLLALQDFFCVLTKTEIQK